MSHFEVMVHYGLLPPAEWLIFNVLNETFVVNCGELRRDALHKVSQADVVSLETQLGYNSLEVEEGDEPITFLAGLLIFEDL